MIFSKHSIINFQQTNKPIVEFIQYTVKHAYNGVPGNGDFTSL